MVLVSAGEYMMDTENGGYWGEAPLHSVYLDNIYIDTFEVTLKDITVVLVKEFVFRQQKNRLGFGQIIMVILSMQVIQQFM